MLLVLQENLPEDFIISLVAEVEVIMEMLFQVDRVV
tara:strand:- start:179 stop:286 length:108 start_codon:yes stop_codon:yes gene_type:complete